ncbi:MAG: response regulator [Elusimicrobia bacterium]|nr:response regulator [Elusimicrobiota bacterium]
MERILIIEDDAELLSVLTLMLSNAGYEVHASMDGQEGYEKIRSLRPDIVLLDLMLPILPGMEVLAKASSDPELNSVPIIVMTAYGDSDGVLERMVLQYGAREYIEKPFRSQEILALIRRTLSLAAPADAPALAYFSVMTNTPSQASGGGSS